MNWYSLDLGWQESFKLAWEAYCMGSIPIGAAIVDDLGKVVGTGRSMQFEKDGPAGQIYGHKLSHAETHALLKVNAFEHPNIRQYILYTTMEPCPLCFGASLMAQLRHIRFAALDGVAGSCSLNDKSEFIAGKAIKIEGPFDVLADYAIAVQTVFEIGRNYGTERLLEAWAKDHPKGVSLGRKLFETGALDVLKQNGAGVEEVYAFVVPLL
ncbi:MAG: nucleoside deaminase [Clostridia bacterium]|nr:nucleoside deaminase [Clostridia bacterium]